MIAPSRSACRRSPSTDRSNLFGLIKFYDACLSAGVKPIVGADLTYFDDGAEPDPAGRYRCIVLAMNETGYRNIITLVSKSYLDAARRGCVDRAWLETLQRRSNSVVGRRARRRWSSAATRAIRSPAQPTRDALESTSTATATTSSSNAHAATAKRCISSRRDRTRDRTRSGGSCHQRRVLHRTRRLRSARDARVHSGRTHAERSASRSSVQRGAVFQESAGDGGTVRRRSRGLGERRRDCEALHREDPARHVLPSEVPGARRHRRSTTICARRRAKDWNARLATMIERGREISLEQRAVRTRTTRSGSRRSSIRWGSPVISSS